MRKRLMTSPEPLSRDSDWLHLEELASVELTSEDPAHPIEGALQSGAAWRAATPGSQVIRIRFEPARSLSRIALTFEESQEERTQEYVLRWSQDGGRTFREIVRQQFHFSPRGATCENEDHRVDLDAVDLVELAVIPNISGGDARATLTRLRFQ